MKESNARKISSPIRTLKAASPQPDAKPRRRKTTNKPTRAESVIPAVPHASKQDSILAMLRQPDGVTIAGLVAATGWQAHSVRGVISGTIRKKLGQKVITESAPDGVRHYRIREEA